MYKVVDSSERMDKASSLKSVYIYLQKQILTENTYRSRETRKSYYMAKLVEKQLSQCLTLTITSIFSLCPSLQ